LVGVLSVWCVWADPGPSAFNCY